MVEVGRESDKEMTGMGPLIEHLDHITAQADQAAAASGLGFWSVTRHGNVHCEGHEDDTEYLVAAVPMNLHPHVTAHISGCDPVTVLVLVEALRRITQACGHGGPVYGWRAALTVAQTRAALEQLDRDLRKVRDERS